MNAPVRSISRRDALKATALAGGALLLPEWLAACARSGSEASAVASTQVDTALLEDIADTLLPDTAASPGAKAAGVGATMALLLADCESPEVRQRVAQGLHALRETCRQRGGAFATLPRAERERLLGELDAVAQKAGEAHWFSSVRSLALNAYFTSEVGATRATRYFAAPGRYEGCIKLMPGQPAWW